MLRPQRSPYRIVHGMMCLRSALALTVLLTACSRPVLYYPTPESAREASTPSRPVAPLATARDVSYLAERHILLPVAGADMTKVADSFDEERDGGERTHRAIDILAPRGTPILSADDGKILRMTNNALGGISMYTVDPEGRLVYYYAHMERYNDAMSVGRAIVRGDTLGYVGTTGNAPKDIPHLHFQVMSWPADGKYWNGPPIDPYEALGGIPRARR